MDQRQALSQMQNLMNFGNNDDDSLGKLIIISAVLTELFLLGIISAETAKIREALESGFDADELADIDNSVADVLAQVCCIEKQIAKKIELGIELRDGKGHGKDKDKCKDKDKDKDKDKCKCKGNGY
jgi:NTP pyrophosphatase (non-canonical NTP hydrolase)